MVENFNLDELDLSAPGTLEALIQLPDEPEVEEESGDSKKNAAFARLRKTNTALKQAGQLLVEKLKKVEEQRDQGQSQLVPSPGTPDPYTQYETSVFQRAGQLLASRGYKQEHPEYGTRFLVACQQIQVQDALTLLRQDMKREQAPTVVNAEFDAAVKKFSLDVQDQSELLKRLKSLDPMVQADQTVVRKEISAYIGENIEKFSKSKEPQTLKDEEEPEGWKLSESPLESGADKKAGAAVGSRIQMEARGVEVPQKSDQGKKEETTLRLSKEDRELMRKAFNPPLDPTNPIHVKRFLIAKRNKENRSG